MGTDRHTPRTSASAEGRAHTAKRRGQPGVRQCVVSRERLPKAELLRLVVGPDGSVAVDLLDRAPGRGVYVRAARDAVLKALGKGIGRTFKGRVRPMAPEAVHSLVEETCERLEDRLVDLVALARRAQVVAIGMDAVVDALSNPRPAEVVAHTSDVSDRSLRRVKAFAPPATRFVELKISKADFGSKLGRNDVGVVAIRPSALAIRIVAEAVRRDGLGALPQSRAREERLIQGNGESAGGRSN